MEYVDVWIKQMGRATMCSNALELNSHLGMDYLVLHTKDEIYLVNHAIVERLYLESLEEKVQEYEEELDQLRFEVNQLKEELNKGEPK